MGKPPVSKVTRDVFPGEGLTVGRWRVIRDTTIFNTWEEGRSKIRALPENAEVSVVTALVVVSKPDHIQVTKFIKNMNLVPGDAILRYAYFGEGEADLWAKGCWYGRTDASFVREFDGTGCQGNSCYAKVTKKGARAWWLRVALTDGSMGWGELENFILAR